MPVDPAETTRVVEINDVEALERELAHGDVACVLIEPALTNIGIVLPEDGYHDAMRRLTREHGTDPVVDRLADDHRHREARKRVDDDEDRPRDQPPALRTDQLAEQAERTLAQEDGQARRHLLFLFVGRDTAPDVCR